MDQFFRLFGAHNLFFSLQILGVCFKDKKNHEQIVLCVYVSNRDTVVLFGTSLKEVDRKPTTNLCQL